MFCTNCGTQIDDRAVICPHCGVATGVSLYPESTPINRTENIPVKDTTTNNTISTPEVQPNGNAEKEYNVLTIMGFIFSLVGFSYLAFGIAGLVCSILGYKKLIKEGRKGKGLAIAGIIISCIAIVVSLITTIVYLVDGGYYYYDYYYYYY